MQEIRNLQRQFEHFLFFMTNQKNSLNDKNVVMSAWKEVANHLDFIGDSHSFILHEF